MFEKTVAAVEENISSWRNQFTASTQINFSIYGQGAIGAAFVTTPPGLIPLFGLVLYGFWLGLPAAGPVLFGFCALGL